MRLLLLFFACSAADPCAGSAACVALTVTSRASLTVDSVRVTAAGAVEGTRSVMSGNDVRLPADVPLVLPAGAGGALDLYVEGWWRGALAGSGEIEVNVNVGAHSRASVDIEPPLELGDMATAPSADLAGTVESACANAVHARCARLATCSPSFLLRVWGTQATCEARGNLDCLEELTAPGSGLDTALVANCASAYAAQTCADRLAGFRPLSCVVSGTRTSGQGCVYDSQCQSGFCKLAAGQACGTCATGTTAGVSSCTLSSDCSGRQSCAMGVCQSFVALNGACSSARPCGEELDCSGGTCKQQGASAGISCGGTQPACDFDRGLFCSGSNVCAVVAAATTQNPQCGVLNGTRVVCTGGADCFSGTCKGPAADGAACDATNGPGCRSPARCVQSVCRLPDAAACK